LLTDLRRTEWAGIVLAFAIGPVFSLIVIAIPDFMYPGIYVACFVFVVQFVILVAGRLKFIAWQLAIVSSSLAFLADDLRIVAKYHANMYPSEVLSVLFVMWGMGTLFSSPLPVYFLLRPMASKKRYVASISVAAAALALWFGMKRITG
jgi:hypothetical protein